MSTELEIIEKKKQAWGNLAVAVHNTEMQLQTNASGIISAIVLPTAIADVQNAENQLKELKKELSELVMSRKQITSKFDDLTARLMLPEKSVPEHLTRLEQAIITLKKADEAEKEVKRQVEAEKLRITQVCKQAIINHEAKCQWLIDDKVEKAYAYALENVSMQQLPKWVEAVKQTLTNEADFKLERPGVVKNLLSVDEIKEIEAAVFICNRDFAAEFHLSLDNKFADFEIALNNKIAALELSKKEVEEKAKKAAQEQAAKELAFRMEASTTVMPEATGKLLKKKYKVKLTGTETGAMAILAAFIANRVECLPFVSVRDWDNFSAKNAAVALEKLKCKDNSIIFSGVEFVEVDKL